MELRRTNTGSLGKIYLALLAKRRFLANTQGAETAREGGEAPYFFRKQLDITDRAALRLWT